MVVLAVLGLALGGCASSGRRAGQGSGEQYAFWPPPPNEPRVQFLRTYRFSSDVEPSQSMFDRIVFGEDVQVVPIAKPYGVAMWDGRIYVCDITNPAVVILDLEKRETRLMVTRGVVQMAQPTDIAIAPDGDKYVVDRRLGRIFKFDASDRHVATFGEDGLVPAGAAVYGDELFVTDFQTQSVLVLDRFTGEQRRSIGGPGAEQGGFVRPLGVRVDDEGVIYVSDAIRGQVTSFSPDGTLLRTLGQLADTPGNFTRPKHLAVDDDGVLYVVDAAFQNVQMFNREGELLMFFGGAGPFPGAMSLPAGIDVHEGDLEYFADLVHPAFEATQLIIVTNQFGASKVSVYALGRLRDGYTVEDIMPESSRLEPPPREAPSAELLEAPGATDTTSPDRR